MATIQSFDLTIPKRKYPKDLPFSLIQTMDVGGRGAGRAPPVGSWIADGSGIENKKSIFLVRRLRECPTIDFASTHR